MPRYAKTGLNLPASAITLPLILLFAYLEPMVIQAGYYAYLWTEMLDDDAFAWFQSKTVA